MSGKDCQIGPGMREGLRSPHSGFTLVELLVVVALLGMATSLVTVRLSGSTDQAQLRAATIQIEQTLRLARHRARTSHEPVWLVFEIGRARYRVATANPSRDAASVWHSLGSVTIKRGGFRGVIGGTQDEPFLVRITATGASLPWGLELWTRSARRVVWTDGITGRVRHTDEIGLHELRWESALEPVP